MRFSLFSFNKLFCYFELNITEVACEMNLSVSATFYFIKTATYKEAL